jgi:drug/metabolite transporter (DMT)-like permease
MTWLFAALSTYLILAIVFLVDKYLLTQRIPNPKVYAFLVGLLGVFALVLVPFVDFLVPKTFQIFLSLLAGAIYIFALFWFYKGLQLFEASRVVPAITGILPLFTFGITFVFSRGAAILNFQGIMAFLLLILGSVLITYKKKEDISLKCLRISVLAAFFLALSFVLTKYVYLAQTFWSGFIWIRLGGVLMALIFFLFLQDIRKIIFQAKEKPPRRTAILFVSNQGLGALASILQNWAIALAPLAYIAIINALQGTQYVFLLIFALILSFKFPQIIKEEVSKEIILQKIIAILLIAGGLALLAF